MIITKLYMDTFGGIANRETIFQPGLNVVVGANETGKSTMFHAIRHVLLTPVTLNKRAFEKTMEPFLPVGGGDTIAAELHFHKDQHDYILKKRWGATSEVMLRLDDGSTVTDEDAIKQKLYELLPSEEGTLKSVFMTYQSGLSNTVAELRKQQETIRSLSDILRKAVMEMDGISVTSFIDELRSRCSEYLEHWDVELKRPERGKNNRPYKTGGMLLKAYNEMEALRDDYIKIQRDEDELAELNAKIGSLKSSMEEEKAFVEKNKPVYEDLLEREKLELQLETLKSKVQKQRSDYDRWPKFAEQTENASKQIPEFQKEIEALEDEKGKAQAIQESRHIAEQFQRVEKRTKAYDEKQKALEGLKKLSRDEVSEIKEIEDELKSLQVGLAAARMTMKLHAKKDVSFTLKQGLNEPSNEEMSRGADREFTAEGYLQLSYTDFDLEVKSSLGDYDAIEKEYTDKKEGLERLLTSHGVHSVIQAEQISSQYEAAVQELHQAKRSFEEELNGENYEELKKKAEEIYQGPEVRPFEDLVQLLAEKKQELSQRANGKKEAQEAIQELENQYGTRDELFTVMMKNSKEEDDVNKKIRGLLSLPDGFSDDGEFKRTYERMVDQEKENEKQLNDLKIEQARKESVMPEESAEEMFVRVKEAQEQFNKTLKRGMTLQKVLETSESLIKHFDQETFTGYENMFNSYSERLTAGKYAMASMEEPLPEGFIRSDGSVLPYSLLSTGTKDVFSLALRLTMAEYFLDGQQGFLIMDDPLVDLDPNRQKLAAELLSDFSQRAQLIIFTCHPSHSVLFEEPHIIDLE